MRALRSLALGLAALACLLVDRASAAPPDPAARGLDVFVHASPAAPSGGALRMELETFGYATVTTPSALGAVSVDAAWDPESFGVAPTTAPPTAHVESDAAGHATLTIAVPEGEAQELKLLVGLRHGEHARTRVLTIRRTKSVRTVVHVADNTVVPGSTINAWVRVTRAASDEPLPNADVDLSLFEGTYARTRLHGKTDAAGMAPFRVPIPDSDDPTVRWELSAAARVGGERATSAEVLGARDETPGAPTLWARFDAPNVRAGDAAAWTVSLRDGAGVPVAGAPLRTWVGQSGMKPPEGDEAWEKGSTPVTTDLRGEVRGSAAAPAVVAPGGETLLRVVVRGEVEGHKLSFEATVPVARSAASVSLTPEAGVLVPGLAQHVLLAVRDGKDRPIAGDFQVTGDGLGERVTTDAHGEADFVWRVPADVGARRDVGPCAGGVAASASVRAGSAIDALRAHPEPFVSCLGVDRELRALVVPDQRVVRAGDKLGVHIVGAPGRDAAPGPWSVVVEARGGAASSTAWIEDGAKGGAVTIPAGEPGEYEIVASSPSVKGAARTARASVLVLPAAVPHVEAKVAGGRVAPGGTVEIDAALTDERGQPLSGTVTAMLVDLEGGGSLDALMQMDTRTRLCSELGVEPARCDDALFGGQSLDPLRRARLAGAGKDTPPLLDPGRNARTDLDAAFSDVLHSLEGAVYEASFDPDRLMDVRRKGPAGFSFNPELLTLTTAAMDTPPLTPGGEPLSLGDLAAVDSQVTFDNVARRVTRYKLFKVLSAVRSFKVAHTLDKDEPALRDPNALLRRLVRSGDLDKGLLVDPWGGSIQFVKAAASNLPFLGAIPGFELRSPGPNGALGDGDDLRDPFARVVRSGSPYALAMDEDRLVDAKLDMEVADTTVSAWETLMESATGTHLGLLGRGEGGGGTGEGYGSGHGRLSSPSLRMGATRVVSALANGDAFFGPPQRTDARGHVHFSVPLGDIETTWGLGLLAMPDVGPLATTKLELAASQPVSLGASAGSWWTTGDEMDVRVVVRNRTAAPVEATVVYEAGGAVSLVSRAAPKIVRVAARSLASFPVRVRAARAGEARLSAKLEAPGQPQDALRYSWEVLPPGEIVTRTSASWVEGEAEVRIAPEKDDVASGRARLVLTRGVGDALQGALASLDPDQLGAPASLADAMEAASRIDRVAQARGVDLELHHKAADVLSRATLRLASMIDETSSNEMQSKREREAQIWLLERRLRAFAPADALDPKRLRKGDRDEACPPELPAPLDVVALSVVPRGDAGDLPCWETFVADATNRASASDDPTTAARALLALVDLPERATSARSLAERLRKLVELRASGAIRLDRPSRAERALVYAALLRANHVGTSPVSDDRLAAWIAVDRDAAGSFGSPEATAAVVKAMTQASFLAGGSVSVTVAMADGAPRTVTVGPSGVAVLGLGDVSRVRVRTEGGGVVARIERPMIRAFSNPPDASESPLRLEVTWPEDARAGHVSTVHLVMGNVSERPEIAIARIPLPPGASMTGPLAGVQQIRGALVISRLVAGARNAVLEVPLRFSLGGRATVREARIVTPRAPLPRGTAPSQAITIR